MILAALDGGILVWWYRMWHKKRANSFSLQRVASSIPGSGTLPRWVVTTHRRRPAREEGLAGFVNGGTMCMSSGH